MTRATSRPAVSTLCIRSSWGPIRVAARCGKVVSCDLPELGAEPHKPFRWLGSKSAATPSDRRVLEQAVRFVRRALAGRAGRPPPFEWPKATPFTLRVWRALAGIPRGEVLEYGALAGRIGRPGGSRAVGRACGANPLPIFIPCHRVLPKDGSLGGFSAGLPWKRLLLERERGAVGAARA
jgi:O-6-methylguanine DNA methyltransferase